MWAPSSRPFLPHARKTPQVTFPAEWPSARSQGMARSWVLTGRACCWRSSRGPAPLLPSALETVVSPAPGGPIHTWAQVPQASPASSQLRARCYEQSALPPKASGLGQAGAQVACLRDTPGLLAHPLCLQQPLGLQPCPRGVGALCSPQHVSRERIPLLSQHLQSLGRGRGAHRVDLSHGHWFHRVQAARPRSPRHMRHLWDLTTSSTSQRPQDPKARPRGG